MRMGIVHRTVAADPSPSPGDVFLGSSGWHRSPSSQAEQREEQRHIVVAEDMPQHPELAAVPWRVSEHELYQEAPLENRLLVAEHLKRVLAVVLPKAALPDAAEREALQPILTNSGKTCQEMASHAFSFAAEQCRSSSYSVRQARGCVHIYLNNSVVECDAPRRCFLDDSFLELLVPGEGVDCERLGLGVDELDAVFDLPYL